MVTMCVCNKISFRELKEIFEANKCKNIDDLRKHTLFSTKCKLCLPYVNKMIETGLTNFDIITD